MNKLGVIIICLNISTASFGACKDVLPQEKEPISLKEINKTSPLPMKKSINDNKTDAAFPSKNIKKNKDSCNQDYNQNL